MINIWQTLSSRCCHLEKKEKGTRLKDVPVEFPDDYLNRNKTDRDSGEHKKQSQKVFRNPEIGSICGWSTRAIYWHKIVKATWLKAEDVRDTFALGSPTDINSIKMEHLILCQVRRTQNSTHWLGGPMANQKGSSAAACSRGRGLLSSESRNPGVLEDLAWACAVHAIWVNNIVTAVCFWGCPSPVFLLLPISNGNLNVPKAMSGRTRTTTRPGANMAVGMQNGW